MVSEEWVESEWRVGGEWVESRWRVSGEWVESEWRVGGEWVVIGQSVSCELLMYLIVYVPYSP